MEKTVVSDRLLWISVIVSTLILTPLLTCQANFTASIWSYVYNWGFTDNYILFTQGPYAMLAILWFLMLVFGKSLRKILNPQYLTYMMMTGFLIGWYSNYYYASSYEGIWQSRRVPLFDVLINRWMIPPNEVLDMGMTGGIPVPWGHWGPVLFWWWLNTIGLWFMMSAFSNLVRKQWLDVEKLPYPQMVPLTTLVSGMTEEKGKPGGSKRLILYGTLIGFITWFLQALHLLIPWFPNIYGWDTPGWHDWVPGSMIAMYHLPSLASQLIGISSLVLNPLYIAIALLIPTEILRSATIWWLILVVIAPEIAYTMGYYPGVKEMDEWGRGSTVAWNAPLFLNAFAAFGVSVGIIVFQVFGSQWRYWLNTIRVAIRGPGAEDAGEPISYRMAYILLILGIIMNVGAYALAGANAGVILALLVSEFLFLAVIGRMYGLIGSHPINYPEPMGALRILLSPYYGYTVTEQNVDAGWWFAMVWGTHGPGLWAYSLAQQGAVAPLSAYKIAESTGASTKKLFQIGCFVAVVAPLLTLIVSTSLWYQYGYAKLPIPKGWPIYWIAWPESVNTIPGPDPWYLYTLGGILLTGVLAFVRIRLPWFPLEPIGLAFVANACNSWWIGYSWIFIIAFPIKWILLKTVGVKVFERYVVPLITGYALGYVIALPMIGSWIAVVKFFFPW